MKVRYVPMDSATANRFRRTGLDDRNGPLRQVTAERPVYPCRHCLRRADPGEQLLLGSYHLELPKGAYWTPSPVFIQGISASTSTGRTNRRRFSSARRCRSAHTTRTTR